MNTKIEMKEQMKLKFLELAKYTPRAEGPHPIRFIQKMETNVGFVAGGLNPHGLDENELERKNPLIVAFGDSVTGGHFEFLDPLEEVILFWKKNNMLPFPADLVDVKEVYHEKFRMKLLEKYPQSSLSVINAGIAGDTILGMEKRVERDVIRYQPDLVIINGSLNWNTTLGSDRDYEEANNPFLEGSVSTLSVRVEIIRKLAKKSQVCLADSYKIWEDFINQGYPIEEMLSNRINHPTKAGHEVFAIELMKLI